MTPQQSRKALQQQLETAIRRAASLQLETGAGTWAGTPAGTRVGVAVSGGADSVALLRLLADLRAELGVVVSAVHFNHKLRGKASDRDEAFVSALAEKLNVTLHVGRGDVAGKAKREKLNLEDAARRARYKFFERLVEQGVVDQVATAHTMDDQAETVLAHMIRGTGVSGLAGIHPVARGVVRPLLRCRRADLRKYLRLRKQAWREDASNRDVRHNRARMRKALMPLLEKKFNPAVVEHLASLADRAREHSGFVDALVDRVFHEHVEISENSARIALAVLCDPLSTGSEPSAAVPRARLILKLAEQTRQKAGQLSAEHIESIVRLAKSCEPGKLLQMPGGVDVLRERSNLVFRPRETSG